MKKTTYIKILITLFLYIFIKNPLPVYAWEDCPKNKVNDPYPGDCARYIDTDNNGICDHSEPAPEDRVTTNNNGNAEEIAQPAKEEGLDENVERQTASTEFAKSISKTNQVDNSFWSKITSATVIVLLHLLGILLYTRYKKAVLKNQ